MNDFEGNEKSQSAFLGLERRRDCARVPNKGFFGEVFAIFGAFFQKVVRFFQKLKEIERFLTIVKKTGSFSRSVEK